MGNGIMEEVEERMIEERARHQRRNGGRNDGNQLRDLSSYHNVVRSKIYVSRSP